MVLVHVPQTASPYVPEAVASTWIDPVTAGHAWRNLSLALGLWPLDLGAAGTDDIGSVMVTETWIYAPETSEIKGGE